MRKDNGTGPRVDLDLALKHGLNKEEYARVLEILGREPSYTELGIFSVMWSEHCSYKNSIAVLKTLPRDGSRVLIGAGEENAGLVDVGEGLAVAFKIESHNHPSAVEPYQGAATGVGGIMRDIFTMGARPVAALNSLRFGVLDSERTRYLMKGVVKGIGDYGNSFGVPTVAGEVYFDACYQENPLVNAMAVGVVKHGGWATAVATGKGNPVMIVGSSTGRDGIHGATFASEEISEESEAKRPSVQVGDPFTEKLLLEATLELIRSGCLIGIQDMGAAGITCSTSEMSARGRSGMRIELDRVPARETGMTAYELMLSESQERMLVVVRRGFEEKVKSMFSKWDLNAEVIGEVTDNGRLTVEYRGEIVADVPAEALVLGGGAPVYVREASEPSFLRRTRSFDQDTVPVPEDLNRVFMRLLGSPNIASRRWVYSQYDHMVRTNNLGLMEGDAGVILLKGTSRALSVKTDCNARYVHLGPYTGGALAVAEAARNVVCTGAIPIAITNCLNFGNPYDPEVYWQFKEAVRGIGDACRALDTPVTGGNVSFYNGSPTSTIYPTPVIGMLGLVESLSYVRSARFRDEGDLIAVLGKQGSGHIGASEYLAIVHGRVEGEPPPIDLLFERRLHRACLGGIMDGLIKSVHDVSDGGIAVAVAECCFINPEKAIGATVRFDQPVRIDRLLFGEDQSRIVISLNDADADRMKAVCSVHNVGFEVIGRVGGNRIRIGREVDVTLSEASEHYHSSLGKSLEKKR